MTIIPQIIMWTAGAVATFAMARIVQREYHRINDELEALRISATAREYTRDDHPTLKRDPRTGVYRP